jgi:hypothetical protein
MSNFKAVWSLYSIGKVRSIGLDKYEFDAQHYYTDELIMNLEKPCCNYEAYCTTT